MTITDLNCSICMSPIEGSPIALSCGHHFDVECAYTLAKRFFDDVSCPNCRHPVSMRGRAEILTTFVKTSETDRGPQSSLHFLATLRGVTNVADQKGLIYAAEEAWGVCDTNPAYLIHWGLWKCTHRHGREALADLSETTARGAIQRAIKRVQPQAIEAAITDILHAHQGKPPLTYLPEVYNALLDLTRQIAIPGADKEPTFQVVLDIANGACMSHNVQLFPPLVTNLYQTHVAEEANLIHHFLSNLPNAAVYNHQTHPLATYAGLASDAKPLLTLLEDIVAYQTSSESYPGLRKILTRALKYHQPELLNHLFTQINMRCKADFNLGAFYLNQDTARAIETAELVLLYLNFVESLQNLKENKFQSSELQKPLFQLEMLTPSLENFPDLRAAVARQLAKALECENPITASSTQREFTLFLHDCFGLLCMATCDKLCQEKRPFADSDLLSFVGILQSIDRVKRTAVVEVLKKLEENSCESGPLNIFSIVLQILGDETGIFGEAVFSEYSLQNIHPGIFAFLMGYPSSLANLPTRDQIIENIRKVLETSQLHTESTSIPLTNAVKLYLLALAERNADEGNVLKTVVANLVSPPNLEEGRKYLLEFTVPFANKKSAIYRSLSAS